VETLPRWLRQEGKKGFDEMWDIPRLYVSACSNSVQLVPLHPIIISILFHHYKELRECISEVEQIEARVSSRQVLIEVARKKEQRPKRTRDSYFMNHEIE
jgi:hypothetical protein